MTRFRNLLTSAAVAAAALAVGPAMTGCYATESAYVIESAPPPPRDEVVVYKPGHVWVHGRWTHPGRHWTWQRGHYERERLNDTYVSGHWEDRGDGHVWVSGNWRPRGSVVILERR
ncbi:MAG: YXWGXW repeat-containing protein [Myxococcales bacterium]|nr:YXWGXW repeat-containing protein [Myxococcales bacterium]